jgi:hypothetical protein
VVRDDHQFNEELDGKALQKSLLEYLEVSERFEPERLTSLLLP